MRPRFVVGSFVAAAIVTQPALVEAQQVPADVQAYLTYMQKADTPAVQATTMMQTQSQLAAQDPSLIFDDAWKVKTAVALAAMQTAGQQMQSYAPVPADAQDLDDAMVALGKDLVASANDYAQGVDNLDGALLTKAAREVRAATAEWDQANAALHAMADSYGIDLTQ